MNPHSSSPAGQAARWIALVLPLLVGGFSSTAQSANYYYNTTVYPNALVPDNSAVGIVSEQTVTGVILPITSLQVYLSLSPAGTEPMFNGDLYVALAHGSDQAILLNRVGRGDGSLAGYADSGFNVTFSDAAPADVHDYRLTLNGSSLTPLSSTAIPAPLTGVWQPDGRNVDPEAVTSASSRTAGLSMFNGDDANGTWSLLVVDLSPNGKARLNSWSLGITAIPEPSQTALLVTGGLVWLLWRKHKRESPGMVRPYPVSELRPS